MMMMRQAIERPHRFSLVQNHYQYYSVPLSFGWNAGQPVSPFLLHRGSMGCIRRNLLNTVGTGAKYQRWIEWSSSQQIPPTPATKKEKSLLSLCKRTPYNFLGFSKYNGSMIHLNRELQQCEVTFLV